MVALISQWDPSSLVYFNTMVHTYPWDLGSLVYFSTMVHTYPWDPGFLVYFNAMVHTYPWDLGIWLYTLITSVGDNSLLRGMECSVAIGVLGGRRAHSDNSGDNSM